MKQYYDEGRKLPQNTPKNKVYNHGQFIQNPHMDSSRRFNYSKLKFMNGTTKEDMLILTSTEMVQIKLIGVEEYLKLCDLFPIINYINCITYESNLPNFVLKYPDMETEDFDFWFTIWKFQDLSTPDNIMLKAGFGVRGFNGHKFYPRYYAPAYARKEFMLDYFSNYLYHYMLEKYKYIDPLKYVYNLCQ